MKLCCRILAVCTSLLLGMSLRAEEPDEVPLKHVKIELTDGRKLKNVVVKSYDAKSERVLLIADGKAMSIPVAVFPKPLNEQLKSAPASGASVTSVAAPSPRPIATAADQYMMETPVRPPAARPPAPQQQVAPRSIPAPDPAAVEAARLRQHLAVAQARAQKFYRYEHQIGSNSITVTSLDFEFEAPKAIGYSGRVETKGKAFIEFYDSVGRSFQRRTSEFEIVTEQDPKEGIKVIDFTRKS